MILPCLDMGKGNCVSRQRVKAFLTVQRAFGQETSYYCWNIIFVDMTFEGKT